MGYKITWERVDLPPKDAPHLFEWKFTAEDENGLNAGIPNVRARLDDIKRTFRTQTFMSQTLLDGKAAEWINEVLLTAPKPSEEAPDEDWQAHTEEMVNVISNAVDVNALGQMGKLEELVAQDAVPALVVLAGVYAIMNDLAPTRKLTDDERMTQMIQDMTTKRVDAVKRELKPVQPIVREATGA